MADLKPNLYDFVMKHTVCEGGCLLVFKLFEKRRKFKRTLEWVFNPFTLSTWCCNKAFVVQLEQL